MRVIKILVAGHKGQVASALRQSKDPSVCCVALGRPALDITDKGSCQKAVVQHEPDIIVNAAAYTAVDQAEKDVATAFLVNRDGARNLAEVAASHAIPYIHISTDYVFNGNSSVPYKEEHSVGPLSVYGLSKLEGEWAVQKAAKDSVIVRTAWVYSLEGHNFLRTMLRLAQQRDTLSVVSDQWGTPTSAFFLSDVLIKMAKHIMACRQERGPQHSWQGIFHLVPDGQTNWADFARAIFEHFSSTLGKKVAVEEIPSSAYPTLAHRPTYSTLCNEKIKHIYGLDFKDWKDYLKALSPLSI